MRHERRSNRRRSRRRKGDSSIEALVELPWWVRVALAAVAFVFLVPLLPGSTVPLWAAGVLLFVACVSALRGWEKRRLLDRQRGIQSIRQLSWKQFEELLGEYYRRQGFRVGENWQGGPDGGVDLRLHNRLGKYLVQCKQWRARKVGVPVVRELYGVVAAEGATGGIVVTSGRFTDEAVRFAATVPVELIDGRQLERLIASVRGNAAANPDTRESGQADLLTECPRCGSPLVLRTAKRGRRVGSDFHGCTSYPKCRYTRDLE